MSTSILPLLLVAALHPALAATPFSAPATGAADTVFLPLPEVLALIVTGLGAGILGGLLGIGGSVIMIPVLTLGFRHDQHLSQAAAMIVNVVVAVASFSQHHRQRAVPWPIVQRMIPAAIIAIIAGVLASNTFDGAVLKRFFGAFLLFIIAANVQRLVQQRRAARRAAATAAIAATAAGSDSPRASAGPGDDPPAVDRLPSRTATTLVATIVGFAAGLLGIGGGIIAVPLCQRVLGLPLRTCIATSATLMCLTAPVGALLKNLTLGSWSVAGESVVIAGVLAPTAILGSLLGAQLTHRLPLAWIRAALVFLMSWAAMKFLGIA